MNIKPIPSKRVAFIKKHYGKTHNRKECCDHLGISEDMFDSICKWNNIKRHNDYWEDWQVEYLLDNYETMDYAKIARAIKRSKDSVHQKLYHMNLKRKTG